MSNSKFNGAIALVCPICGSNQINNLSDGVQCFLNKFKCSSCKSIISKDELFAGNQKEIKKEHQGIAKEIRKEIQIDFTDVLKKTFKGSKYIKFK